VRDIKADYKRALVEEYEAYRRSGRTSDAEQVAAMLRDHYGHEVEVDAPERADAERPPEDTAKPKPARTTKRPAARKPPASS
jgi:hypothetical protein